MNKALFGVAGRAESFTEMGYKKMSEVPDYLSKFDIKAFEYQCGRGVRYNELELHKLSAIAKQQGITFSLHAPYFISMSSVEEEKRRNSTRYILESAKALRVLEGERIIFHSGSCGKLSREQAIEYAVQTMEWMVQALDENGYSDMTLCPETMGKINQLGTLDEVMTLCSVDKIGRAHV